MRWRNLRASLLPAGRSGSLRVEYRPPDPSANPYLAFAAMTMAGLPPSKAAKVKQVPGSLDVTLRALETDHKFLLEADVFTRDVIETWIETKRKKDVDFIRLRPHPSEFHMYYDV